jgi:2'-5' RNA ligase
VTRLFIAVWLPENVVDALMSLRRKDQLGVRFIPPENWHITLRFLGEANTGEVIDALDGVRLPPTEAVLGPAVDVIDERALMVPVSGLEALAAEVAERTRRIGSEPPRKRFVGHLTLARVKSRTAMPATLGELFHASFDVPEIALVQSRLHPQGARYETLQTWPVEMHGQVGGR